MNPLHADWHYPTEIRIGAGRRHEIAEVCRARGINAPLFVTDAALLQLPVVKDLREVIGKAGLGEAMFCEIQSNPDGECVSAGVAAYQRGECDGVIALGGGSALDAGKAIALMARQTCALWDLEDAGDNWQNADAALIAPTIALPSTAGTGSEVGRASVIVNPLESRKVIIFHPRMLPDEVILDPELTLALPPKLTAATGMDALSHNLEAFCSPLYHPLAEGVGVEGMRIIKHYLPRAVADGGDIEARTQMLAAACMGATAFQRGLGAMHALAHPLGAVFDAHHGMLNAILMPYVLRANREAIKERIARLADYLQVPGGFDGFLAWVLKLRAEIGIHETLAEIGIDAARADEIGRMAVEDPSAATNPIQFSAEEYAAILTRAVKGESG